MHFSKIILAVVSSATFLGGALAYKGDATYYNPSVGTGACGWNNGDGELVAALSPTELNNKINCGRFISVTYQGVSVTAKVVDLCPSCASGSIDLSPGAFNQLADPGIGRIPVQWDWTQ